MLLILTQEKEHECKVTFHLFLSYMWISSVFIHKGKNEGETNFREFKKKEVTTDKFLP